MDLTYKVTLSSKAYETNNHNILCYEYFSLNGFPIGIYKGDYYGLFFYKPFNLIKSISSGIKIHYRS